MLNNDAVAIVSQAAIFPDGEFGRTFSTSKQTLEQIPTASRRLMRYMSDSAASAISVAGTAMMLANVSSKDDASKIGIYASQHGYLNPHFREFTSTLTRTQPQSVEQAYQDLWHGQEVSPFVVTKMLSNNLLAILSLHFGIRGDCAALIRDSAGSSAALLEAMHSVQYQHCDTAMIVSAGADHDFLQDYFDQKPNSVGAVNVGAVAFMLQNAQYAKANGQTILGVIQESISSYSLENVLAQLHAQLQDQQRDIEFLIDMNHSADIPSIQQKFSQFQNINFTDMSQISGERACDSCLTLLHAALKNRQNTNSLLVVLNGSRDEHFSSVIVSQDV